MPSYTNFFWATIFIIYDPLEFSTGACPTPSGLEIGKTHHCALWRSTNWPNDLFCSMYTIQLQKKVQIFTKKKIIDISWVIPLIFKDVRKETELQYIHTYLCQTVRSSWKAINQLHLPEWSQLSKRIIIHQKASIVPC